eukprot:m.467146 g.467146  ORF g.467146 m.467146 type:complete len:73 (+) comp20364_c0_seq16:112-330(+)
MACAAPSPSLPPTCVNCGKDSFIYEHCSVCNGPIHDAVGFCDTSEHEGKLYLPWRELRKECVFPEEPGRDAN